jgi:hypothetical protein
VTIAYKSQRKMEEERKTQVESEDQQDFKFKLDVQLTALSTSLICRNSKGIRKEFMLT